MTLVLAGFHGWNTQEAELAKRDPAQEANVFPVIKPVVEKMASIVRNYLRSTRWRRSMWWAARAVSPNLNRYLRNFWVSPWSSRRLRCW